MELMFKMIRACIGITDIKDLWFNEDLDIHSHFHDDETREAMESARSKAHEDFLNHKDDYINSLSHSLINSRTVTPRH